MDAPPRQNDIGVDDGGEEYVQNKGQQLGGRRVRGK